MRCLLRREKYDAGAGLVELMLVLFLSSCIITLLLNQLVLTKKHEKLTTDALSKAYDLQMLGDLLKTSIRQAGYTPCAAIDKLTRIDHTNPGVLPQAIVFESSKMDGVAIYYMSSPLEQIAQFISSSQIRIPHHHIFSKEEPLIIADCFHAEIVRIQSIKSHLGDSIVTFTTPLSFIYKMPVYIGRWQPRRFMMKKNSAGFRRLYFQYKHAEILSDWVEDISVKLIEQAPVKWLEIRLRLSESDLRVMNTRVRAA